MEKILKPQRRLFFCKISPRVNTISSCKNNFARKMLPISQKGKNTTIFFVDCHNVLFKENYFFIRGQSFCVGIRKMDKRRKKLEASHTHLLICPLLILNPEQCREGGPRQCFKEDEVCLHLLSFFPFYVFIRCYSYCQIARATGMKPKG